MKIYVMYKKPKAWLVIKILSGALERNGWLKVMIFIEEEGKLLVRECRVGKKLLKNEMKLFDNDFHSKRTPRFVKNRA